jgi:hypothetical protein
MREITAIAEGRSNIDILDLAAHFGNGTLDELQLECLKDGLLRLLQVADGL